MSQNSIIYRFKEYLLKKLTTSNVPILVYIVIVISMAALWYFRIYNEDIALNFLAELFGAAFTLFIIDFILVKSKEKRWRKVKDEIEYLVSRQVYTLRDGLSFRVFHFIPDIDQNTDKIKQIKNVAEQRHEFLRTLEIKDELEILTLVNEDILFDEITFLYFRNKKDNIWNMINTKYSDFFNAELISMLMELHINIIDLCSSIRQYNKHLIEDDDETANYYKMIGMRTAIKSITAMIYILNKLDSEGFSSPNRFRYISN
jgi:hypothetical protein